MINAFYLIVACMLLVALPARAQTCDEAHDDASGARLFAEPTGDLWQLTAAYEGGAQPPAVLRYELEAVRTGSSSSRTKQGGRFEPQPGVLDTLSSTRINIGPGDRLSVHLRLSDESGRLVGHRCVEVEVPE